MIETILHPISKKVFVWYLIGVLLMLFGAYIYFVQLTVVHAVARNNAEETLRDIQSDMLDMEFQYLNKSNNLTLDTAYEQGFSDSVKPVFVDLSPVALGFER